MANIIKMGTLLLEGSHTEPVSKYQPGQAINLGDGDDLQWVVVNGLLIADRPLLTNISWDDLHQQDLVFGKQVKINGQQFLCRLLRVGAGKGVQNEWDDALDAVGEDDSLWHWENAFCWGQEPLDEYESKHAYRGCNSARYWDCLSSSYRNAYLSFRPALAALRSDNLIPGSEVCAIGGQSVLYGTLLELTDYDAIIRPTPTSMIVVLDEGKIYAKLNNGAIAIDQHLMAVQVLSNTKSE